MNICATTSKADAAAAATTTTKTAFAIKRKTLSTTDQHANAEGTESNADQEKRTRMVDAKAAEETENVVAVSVASRANADGSNNNNGDNSGGHGIVNNNVAPVSRELVEAEADFQNNLQVYSATVALQEHAEDDHDLMKFKSVAHHLYAKTQLIIIDMPRDKFKSYMKMVQYFGYEMRQDRGYLLNGGFLNVLRITRPFFTFWDHGLSIYFHKGDDIGDKFKIFLFKRSHCSAHKYICPENNYNDCIISEEVKDNSSASFFFTGILRARTQTVMNQSSKNQTFTALSVQLDNGCIVETVKFNISNTLTLKKAPQTVKRLKLCDHRSCGSGIVTQMLDLPDMYSECSQISQSNNVLTVQDDSKRVYFHCKGIFGNLHENSNTLYLYTFDISDMFIVDPL